MQIQKCEFLSIFWDPFRNCIFWYKLIGKLLTSSKFANFSKIYGGRKRWFKLTGYKRVKKDKRWKTERTIRKNKRSKKRRSWKWKIKTTSQNFWKRKKGIDKEWIKIREKEKNRKKEDNHLNLNEN